MMEASGKKNRMFAGINSLNKRFWLFLISLCLCGPDSFAQQLPEKPQGEAQTEDSRRIERLGEGGTQQWEIDLSLPATVSGQASGSGAPVLPDQQQNLELQQLLSSLALDPGNRNVLAELRVLLTDVLTQANQLIDSGAPERAEILLASIKSIDPGLSGFDLAQERLQASRQVITLLDAGNAALASGRILEPENDNALDYFRQALIIDAVNPTAAQGLAMVQQALIDLALESARELDFETAETWLKEASNARSEQAPVEGARIELAAFKSEYAVELEQKAIKAMNAGNFSLADINIIDLIALGGQQARVDSLRARLEETRTYGGQIPGQLIRDELLKTGGFAPEIVVIPAGSFLMGSPDNAEKEYASEKPLHRVTFVLGFALGVREVSVDEFGLFIQSTGYRTTADINGNSKVYDEVAGRLTERAGVNWRFDYQGKKARGDMPVLHVSHRDALAYVHWLAKETGKAYRLPSEAEFEYVARAGGKSSYWWGEGSPPKAVENLSGDRDQSPRKRQWTTSFKNYGDGFWGPGPVGSMSADELVHPMGVFDITGNVSEWMEDCWHQNYIKAPVDGTAWVNPGCNRRVGRGGYWASGPGHSRAAYRIPVNADNYGPVFGIRIARDL